MRAASRAPISLRVSDPGADPRVIRRRARRDGYVFCRALVPRDQIDALRGHALAVAEDLGWLDADAPPGAALAVTGASLGGAPPESDAGDLCRVVSSDDPAHTTVAHQDRFYLPGGAPRWSMWVPLGRCPLVLGPLAVLPGSHERGLLPHTGDVAWRRGVDVADDAGWAASDLEPGDAIFFSWLTVHRALPNASGRALRLSATCRYRSAGRG